MHPLYSVDEIRAIERAAAAQLGQGVLMRRAGHAAAELALQLLAGSESAQVLVLAGPGNNGGDALEVAAHLADANVDVSVMHVAGANPSQETAAALERARASSVQFIDIPPQRTDWQLVVDGLFGIGLARALEGQMRAAVLSIADQGCPVLALDVPSGLNADTGAVVGAGGIAVRATHTITFIGDKPGLHTCDGRDHAGIVSVAALAIDPAHVMPVRTQLNQVSDFAACLAPRPHNSHKGSYGNVAVLGGAQGMSGAPLLAARAALYGGAGRVYITPVDGGPMVDSVQPELMFRNPRDFDFASATVVAGPGMGSGAEAAGLLRNVLGCDSPLVLDADALNLIAAGADLQAQLTNRAAATVLTPHPLEAARLLGETIGAVQADRLAAARTLAARYNATVVLKGSGSIIAAPDGRASINPTGNPGLATAGSGDVLAGCCGALFAQGWPEWETALAAVWMHGMAADCLADDGIGPIGMTAGELPAAIRAMLNQLVQAQPTPGDRQRS